MEASQISLYLMVGLYVLAGINHFIMPKTYLKITPPWVPQPEKVNWLVGLAEIGFTTLSGNPRSSGLGCHSTADCHFSG